MKNFTKSFWLLLTSFALKSAGFAQQPSTHYKNAQDIPGANYNTVVAQWRSFINQKVNTFVTTSPGKPLPNELREEQAQFERWAYNWRDKINFDGSFPETSIGLKHFVLNRAASQQNGNAYTTQITSATWTSIGPTQTAVLNGWTYGAGIGRINVVKKQPGSNVLLAGSAAGGVFRSTDYGANWVPATDNIAGLGVSDIVFDPNNPNIVYMATGDYDARHIASLGVYKSTNGGISWAPTGFTFTLNLSEYLAHIAIDPANSNTLLATGNSKIYKSTDAGATWTDYFDPSEIRNFNDIVSVGGIWYASDRRGKLWKENPAATDNSTRFTEIYNAGTVQRLDIAISAAAPGFLYILKQTNPAFGKYNISTSTMGTFTNVTNANPSDDNANFNTQQGYNQVIAVSPTNADSIWVGEFSGGKLSTDGGSTWQNKLNGYYDPGNTNTQWGGFYVHSDQHCFEFVGSDTLLISNDGGVYTGKISSNQFTEKFNGLATTQSYSMAIYDPEPNNFIIGNQDNDGGSRLLNSGTYKFHAAQAGDGTATAISRTNSNIRYVGGTNGSLSHRTDGYATEWSGQPVNSPTSSAAPFVWDLQMHSTDGTIIYGGYTGIYKMTGAPAGTWTLLNTGATSKVASIALANKDATSQKIIIIQEDNGVKKSADESTWTDITLPSGVNFSSIYAGKNNWDTLFATAKGYDAANKIFMSIDNGANWTNITKNFPNVQAKKIIRWEGHDSIFVATEVGVYKASIVDAVTTRTPQGATPWSLYGTGLPIVRVEDMEISNTKSELYVASFGRGVWVAPLTSSIPVALHDINFSYKDESSTKISLNWEISDIMAKTTILEESSNGTAFTRIGTYSDANRYRNSFWTNKPTNIKYYRLLYETIDGRKYYSNILVVREKNATQTIVYPNPATEYVQVNNPQGIKYVRLVNTNGQQLAYAAPNANSYLLPLRYFPKGTYTIQITTENEKTESKLIQKR